MTTKPKNELLPCPFCAGEATLSHGNNGSDETYDCLIECLNNDCPVQPSLLDHFKYDGGTDAPAIAAWNTRPAKAVQGDVTKARKRFDYLFDTYLKERAENNYATMQFCKEVRSALTPESEGIAGRGDALAKSIETAKRFANREYFADSNNGMMASVWFQDLIDNAEAALSTLARPQEIDVEALKDDLIREAKQGKFLCHRLDDLAAVIDHLHSSGRLR